MIHFENPVPEYAPDSLLAVAVLVGVWLLVTVVRYVRVDRGTRVSMRPAVRVRWGWVQLARMAGLTVTDKTPACRPDHRVQGRPRHRAPRPDTEHQGGAGPVRRGRSGPDAAAGRAGGVEEARAVPGGRLAVHAGVRAAGPPRPGGDPGRALRPPDHADHTPAHRPPARGADALRAGASTSTPQRYACPWPTCPEPRWPASRVRARPPGSTSSLSTTRRLRPCRS